MHGLSGPSGGEPISRERAETVFVGRQRETAELCAALDEALTGHGRVVLLLGEPGIGKTRTAEEFALIARARGARVLWGRCHEGEGAPAYWPWVQVIRSYARDLEPGDLAAEMGRGAADIAHVVPEVRERLPDLDGPPPLEPEQARFRLFDSVATFLENATRNVPLVVVLDDLHWADAPSLLLLEFLAREMPYGGARLVLVGTYRDVEIDRQHPLARVFARLARAAGTRRLLLQGLSDEEVARYVELVAGRAPTALLAAVCRQTEGNPFFLGEVVRLLADEGCLDEKAEASGLRIRLPQGVRQAVGQRLDRLSAECRRVLPIAAAIGRDFDVAVLEQVSETDRERLLEAIDEARAARLLDEVGGALGRYVFTHALVHETLDAELATARRIALHRRIAEVLEQLCAADPEPYLAELAYHYHVAAQAGGADKAIEYGTRAGRRASDLLAYEEAAGHYRRAVEALAHGRPADHEARYDLLLALGRAEMRASDASGARKTFQQAADVARRLGSAERLARVALGLGEGWLWGTGAGREDEVLAGLLEEGLSGVGERDSELRALLLARLAVAVYWSASPERASSSVSLAQSAVEMARRLGDPTIELGALASLHWTDSQPGGAADRLTVANRFLAIAERLGDRGMALLGHAFHVVDLIELGDVAGADEAIERYSSLAEELRQPSSLWYAPGFRAMRATMQGRFDVAEAWAAKALATGRRARSEIAVQAFGAQMLAIRREQGRLAEVGDVVAGVAERFAAADHLPAYAWRCMLAELHCELGREVEARRELDRLAADGFAGLPRDTNACVALALLARVCAALGDGDRARSVYERLLPYDGGNVVLSFALFCDGAVSRFLGLLAGLLGRWEDAERHFEAALELNARMGAAPALAYTRHEYAVMLLARGGPSDRERTLELLDQAIASARELGMKPLLERATALRAGAEKGAELAAEPAAKPGSRGLLGEPAPPSREAATVGSSAALDAAEGAASIFRREGEYWTIAHEGKIVRVKDAKGLRYIAYLLAHPDRDVHALDLVAMAGGRGGGTAAGAVRPLGRPPRDDDLSIGGLGGVGVILDARARSEYRRRLEEARAELEEAESFNDLARAAKARAEIAFIGDQLAAAVGLRGREREAGSSAERARLTVTQRVKAAVRRIGEGHPALGRHLATRIKTGTFCAYRPDPDRPITWMF